MWPSGHFVSLVCYPFDEDRAQLEHRLKRGAAQIDDVVFAGNDEESVQDAVMKVYRVYEKLK